MKSDNARHLHETGVQSNLADQSTDGQPVIADDRFTHLSAFGLNGMNGKVQWHHVAGDFEKNHTKVLNISCYL